MSVPDHYLMTVALHASVLSVAVFLAIFSLRKPQRVALTALCGTLAISLLPWLSAMRPPQADVAKDAGQPIVSPVASLPEWTVVRIPVVKAPTAAVATSSSFAMPDAAKLGVAMWALGSVVALGALLVAGTNVSRWRRTLEQPDDTAWHAILDAAPDVPGRCRFRISPVEGSPCVAGFFKPVVVVPSFLLDPAKHRELRWALRHELRHWRGSDSRWTMLLEIARVIQWWNPFVHLLISRWKVAREHICDLAASDDDRATYGEFLIEMAAKPVSRNPLAVTMVRRQRMKTLKARIVAVLNAAPGSGTPFEKSVLFAACGAMLGTTLLISGVKIGEEKPVGFLGTAAATEVPEKADPEELAARLKIQTKIIIANDALVKNESVRDEAAIQDLMRMFAQKKGTTLVTAPSVKAQTDEVVMIEVLREHPDDPPWDPGANPPGPRTNRFVGWSIRITPTYAAGKIGFSAEVGYGFIPGVHHFPGTHDKIAWNKLVRKNATGRGRLDASETLAIDLGEVEPGQFGTVLMTITPLDAMGRPVENFEQALQPVPIPVDGTVKLRGTVLERETFEQFDFDYQVDQPMYAYSISKAAWNEMKRTLGVKNSPAVAVEKKHASTLAGELWAQFSGELLKIGDRIQPRLHCWLKRGKEPFQFQWTTPGLSLDASTDQVEIFRLPPEKEGMTRLLFIEVETEVK